MTTDEMKAAIEYVGGTFGSAATADPQVAAVLELAEIGRLAVEAHRITTEPDWEENIYVWAKRANAADKETNSAASAFLAKHGGGA